MENPKDHDVQRLAFQILRSKPEQEDATWHCPECDNDLFLTIPPNHFAALDHAKMCLISKEDGLGIFTYRSYTIP